MKHGTGSAFVSGGGAMGERLRRFDWAATPLGPIAHWPLVLRLSVETALASAFPSCLFWGPDLVAIYNDAYVPLLGEKPDALGQPLRVTWSEVWEQLQPIAEKAMRGEPTFIENYRLPTNRHGHVEDAYFTFCYSPVYDEHGQVQGLLDTVIETTAQVRAQQQASAERERLQGLLQQFPGFIAVLSGPDHVYAYANDQHARLVGGRAVVGKTVKQAMPEVASQGYVALLDRVYHAGEAFTAQAMPLSVSDMPGQMFIDLVLQPMRDAGGAITGIFVAGHDVSEHVRAEARLRDLNTALEQEVVARTLERGRTWQISPELLGVLNSKGVFETSNPAWQVQLGWSEQELATTFFMDFIHPDDLPRTRQAWADAMERGQPALRFENRYRVKGGGWRWLSWVAVPDRNKVYCSARDIQDEKDREATFAQRTAERDTLARIVQSTSAQIQVVDCNFRFLAINQAAAEDLERMLGTRPQVGDSLLDVLGRLPQERDRVASLALWRRAMAGEAFAVTHDFENRERVRRHYELRFEVLRNPAGEQVGAFLTSIDTTQLVLEQASLQATQEALRQAQKMEAVGHLTGGLAHDFNNLLAAISASLQVMKVKMARGQAEGIARYLDISDNATRRAAALTQRLLAFSRRQTLDPRPLDLNRLVQGMHDLIQRSVGPDVVLHVTQEPALWTTRADPSQVENALLNLCINARDAMAPYGGRLSVTTRNLTLVGYAAAQAALPEGDYVELCVTDTGAGIAGDVLDRIFDPFFTTKPTGQGTGLGLSMVYGFARQSGGHVRVDTEIGRGTTMHLNLPRHHGAAEAAVTAPSVEAAAAGPGETVGLIEDEAALRALIAETLADAGYRVVQATDGPAGLSLMQSAERIDLIVTDVGLPGGLNGRQVADAGRALRPGLKVLFLTGYAEATAAGDGMRRGDMEVMTKPFELPQLLRRIREMLDSGAAERRGSSPR